MQNAILGIVAFVHVCVLTKAASSGLAGPLVPLVSSTYLAHPACLASLLLDLQRNDNWVSTLLSWQRACASLSSITARVWNPCCMLMSNQGHKCAHMCLLAGLSQCGALLLHAQGPMLLTAWSSALICSLYNVPTHIEGSE